MQETLQGGRPEAPLLWGGEKMSRGGVWCRSAQVRGGAKAQGQECVPLCDGPADCQSWRAVGEGLRVVGDEAKRRRGLEAVFSGPPPPL